ncbi:MAG: tetraacyldisaccharide 4'-kinase [Candidatus Cloacimonadota bacterium]|nr:tetraacyldisaccharide 4'-kinase [Candidatus Cloacimonadota bacterium]
MSIKKLHRNFIQEHWDNRSLTSFLLLPFALFYSLIQYLRRSLFSAGVLSSYQSKSKIISVGNLGIGGNGKTPFTIYLAKYLQAKGNSVSVSHRGYKGEYENSIKIISDENGMKKIAENAGDEPQVIAENLSGISVIVGKDRTKAIKLLEEKIRPDYVILDDSFQHLKIKRDIDFVLFDAKNPLGNGFTIPAGKLREPKSTLKHADFLVFNNCPENYQIPKWAIKYKKPIIKTIYKLSHFIEFSSKKNVKPETLQAQKVFLLSGIGTPNSFEKSIENTGIIFSEHFVFPDHYAFDQDKDIQPIIEKAIRQNVAVIITTEKDYVKLKDILPAKNHFLYAKLEIEVVGNIAKMLNTESTGNTENRL